MASAADASAAPPAAAEPAADAPAPAAVPLAAVSVGMWASRRARSLWLLILHRRRAFVVLVDRTAPGAARAAARRRAAAAAVQRSLLKRIGARSPFAASAAYADERGGCCFAFEVPWDGVCGADYSNELLRSPPGRLVLEVRGAVKREFRSLAAARAHYAAADAAAGRPAAAGPGAEAAADAAGGGSSSGSSSGGESEGEGGGGARPVVPPLSLGGGGSAASRPSARGSLLPKLSVAGAAASASAASTAAEPSTPPAAAASECDASGASPELTFRMDGAGVEAGEEVDGPAPAPAPARLPPPPGLGLDLRPAPPRSPGASSWGGGLSDLDGSSPATPLSTLSAPSPGAAAAWESASPSPDRIRWGGARPPPPPASPPPAGRAVASAPASPAALSPRVDAALHHTHGRPPRSGRPSARGPGRGGAPRRRVPPPPRGYPFRQLVLWWSDPGVPGALRPAVEGCEPLTRLVESGLPAWAVFMPSYGLYYRPWLRRATWAAFYAFSFFSLAAGFYDLYKTLPGLRLLVGRLLASAWAPTAALRWLEAHAAVRLSLLATYVLGQSATAAAVARRLAAGAAAARAAAEPALRAAAPVAAAARDALAAPLAGAAAALAAAAAPLLAAALAPLAAAAAAWRSLCAVAGLAWAAAAEAAAAAGGAAAAARAALGIAAPAGASAAAALPSLEEAWAAATSWVAAGQLDAWEALRASALRSTRAAHAVARFFTTMASNAHRHRLTLSRRGGRAWARAKASGRAAAAVPARWALAALLAAAQAIVVAGGIVAVAVARLAPESPSGALPERQPLQQQHENGAASEETEGESEGSPAGRLKKND